MPKGSQTSFGATCKRSQEAFAPAETISRKGKEKERERRRRQRGGNTSERAGKRQRKKKEKEKGQVIKGEGNRAGAAARLFITRRAVRRSYPPVSSLPRCGASLTPSLILCCLLALPTSPTSDPHTPFHRWRTASLHPTAIRSSESPLRRPGGTRYERPSVPLPQPSGHVASCSLYLLLLLRTLGILLSLSFSLSPLFLSVLFLARARSFSPSPVLLSRITPRRDRVLSPLAPSTYVYIADTCGHICSHVRTDVRAFSRIQRVG